MKVVHVKMLTIALFFGSLASFSQENANKALTMENAFELAIRNSAQLKVTRENTALARQKIAIAQLGRLPGISNTFNYGYISNSQICDPLFWETY